jgi:hypothetical protein
MHKPKNAGIVVLSESPVAPPFFALFAKRVGEQESN